MKMLYLQNTSGSQLEVATVALIMEKNAISADCFPEDKLSNSSEIKKLQNIKFIKLVEEKDLEAARQASVPVKPVVADVVEEFFNGMEQPQAVQRAILKVEDGLNQLKALLTGKPAPKMVMPKAQGAPQGDSEATTGTFVKTNDEEEGEMKTEASKEDESEFIPDFAPKGMEPKNDPVKKLLGKAPYTTPQPYNEKLKFISGCMDIGMLREIAIFEVPGRVKDMAKKKLKEAKSVAQV